MSKTVQLGPELRLAGLCMQSAFPGEEVLIEYAGFHSSSEGDFFARATSSLTEQFLKELGRQPFEVDHLLVVLDFDGKAEIYFNELKIEMTVRSRKAVVAGEQIFKNQVAEIVSVELGVEIPPTSAFFFVFSQGWRKGLLFDFGPFQNERPTRRFDIGPSLGIAYANLLFHERFVLAESEWSDLIARGWFLFLGLPDAAAERMVEFLRSGKDLELLLPEIESQIPEIADQAIAASKSNTVYSSHTTFLERALERFKAGDFVSAAHILFPRIEGMLRSYHAASQSITRPTQRVLLDTAFPQTLATRFQYSMLRPDQFSSFIGKVIFPDFDWKNPSGSTRHTVGHGVVGTNELTSRSVSIAFLTVHHLLFALPAQSNTGNV